MGDWESTITVGAEGAEAEAVNQRNEQFVYTCSSCHKEACHPLQYAPQEHVILAYQSMSAITLNGIAQHN